jgi:hypothetical protein
MEVSASWIELFPKLELLYGGWEKKNTINAKQTNHN